LRLPQNVFRDLATLLPDLSSYPPLRLPFTPTPWLSHADPLLRKTCAAAVSLQHELIFGKQEEEDREIFRQATYGFIAIDSLMAAELRARADFRLATSSFTFGVAILVGRGSQPGRLTLRRLVRLAGQQFPVIEITSSVIRHGTPPHPTTPSGAGTSTCWAQAKSSGLPWSSGIITAGHVVHGLALGSTVCLTPSSSHASPSVATLVDVGTGCIDAALLQVSATPSGLSALTILDPAVTPIAPGMAVQMLGRHTSDDGFVLRALQIPGYGGNLTAEQCVFDFTGVPGDSGALIFHSPLHAALGLYTAAISSTVHGTYDGLAQGMWQASRWFGADAYL
jgi:hypothetical protein